MSRVTHWRSGLLPETTPGKARAWEEGQPDRRPVHHDDERGLVTTYMLRRPTQARLWLHFLVNTPTIVATVDAALATVIVVFLLQAADASRTAVVAAALAAFLAVWGTLFPMQRYTLHPLRDTTPRFPTPQDAP